MQYNKMNEIYIGLHKIAFLMDPSKNYYPQKVVRKHFFAQTKARASLKNPLSANSATGYQAEEIWSNSPDLSKNSSSIRASAPKIIAELSEIAVSAENISTATKFPVYIAGKSLATFTTHDDYRPASIPGVYKPDEVPKACFWLYQFENSSNGYTWVLLSGTADQNHIDYNTNRLPTKRSGSGTERIYEYLHTLANGRDLEGNGDPRTLAGRYSLLSTIYYIIGYNTSEYEMQDTESIFQVKKIYEFTNKNDLLSPYRDLMKPRANHSSKEVNTLILGTPYIVQHKEVRSGIKNSSQISLFQKWMKYFGFKL